MYPNSSLKKAHSENVVVVCFSSLEYKRSIKINKPERQRIRAHIQISEMLSFCGIFHPLAILTNLILHSTKSVKCTVVHTIQNNIMRIYIGFCVFLSSFPFLFCCRAMHGNHRAKMANKNFIYARIFAAIQHPTCFILFEFQFQPQKCTAIDFFEFFVQRDMACMRCH